jgi:type VI secretion system protein ImpG
MHDLLPHYERELSVLRRHGREFGERFPKIAARLLMSGEVCEDPHVERLLQSFALLSARIHKKLDDDFPELTETLLGVLYPHYLRPFPSCSIARFDAGGGEAQLTAAAIVPRGTMTATRTVKGVACRFRTVYDVSIAPLRVAAVGFEEPPVVSRGYRLPATASAAVSLTIESLSEQVTLPALKLPRLRLFLDGEPSVVSQLREALLARLVTILVEDEAGHTWREAPASALRPVGFDIEEGLLDYDARSLLAYRLLTEFFAYPEKFNFIDLDLSALCKLLPPGARRLRLKLLLSASRNRDQDAHLLERIGVQNFVLGCTPVINLFNRQADPIRITHTKAYYPMVVDSRRAFAYELYAVRSVNKVEKTPHGEAVIEYRPFYALRHAETLDQRGRFWHLRRDDYVATASPGYEWEVCVIDHDFDAEADKTETLSIEVSATNRDLPSQLPYGMAGGDLTIEGGSVARSIRFLRKPTATYRFERAGDALWRLISLLSLNHLSLTESGLESLKETLVLYNIARSPLSQRIIDGMVAIGHRPTTARMAGNPFPTFVKGIEIDLTVDEQAYVGIGLSLFIELLDHFFALYVHANSFSQLVVRSAKTGEVLKKCLPRSGETVLA